ncbi:molybdopterin-dependent oxidoreductase [Nocardia sp. CNY236]|uniref:molybdopterin-dependent oxidoreductase n=1 Tax=Nocardia sp. CNY236 TaxID=1169152 RepID=UPI000687B0F1|nr:molybdopterin-dependent oxidoreductase [Nocardia sp. CNY236]
MSARGPEVASRVGSVLGIAITVCFVTGLISHWIQHPPEWFWWPPRPVWLYRVTQGAHVISGVAAIPLLLVKLWAVYPRLFERPLLGSPLRVAERGSIALLVGAVIFELATGLANIAQYYPWKFFFPAAHYAMAYVAAGALAVHLAVKLPVIRDALSRPLESDSTTQHQSTPHQSTPSQHRPAPPRHESTPAQHDSSTMQPDSPDHGATPTVADEPTRRVGRRTVLTAAWLSAAAAGLAIAGQTVPFLRWAAFLAPRSGEGPQGVPVNRSAEAAAVAERARDPEYRLRVRVGDRERELTRADLAAMPQASAQLPIACVEGWSASAHWAGVRVRDLLALVGYTDGDVRFESLETNGIYRSSVLPQRHVMDPDSLVALQVNGEPLNLDHGYPCRLIAPNRPGVLQTKWLSRIEALS